MKVKRFQRWKKVNYGNKKKFKFWSHKIKGEGDKALTKDSPLRDWKKIIVLRSIGDPETTFSMGFSTVSGDTKVSNVLRKIKKGSFGMRLGPEDCNFFIASNESKVGLELVEYTDITDESKLELPLY